MRAIITTLLILAAMPAMAQVVDVRVSTGNDDVEERSSGSMKMSSSDMELVEDKGRVQTVGLRFRNITIPLGATITKAYIQFTVDEKNSVLTSLAIRGQSSGDAPPFTSASFDVTSRLATINEVSWSNIVPWSVVGVAGMNQQTPDLSVVVQEIVSGLDWVSGGAMVFMITGAGERTAEAYNGVAAKAALLHIEFDGGASINRSPSAFDASPVVGENLPAGTPVAFLDNVIDQDVGDLHTFAVISDGPFEVIGDYFLATTDVLDYETAMYHDLLIAACDDGTPVWCVEQPLRVVVLDDTTEPPPPPPPPVTSVVMGNIGDYGRANEHNLAVSAVLRAQGAEFITTNGDNCYGNSSVTHASVTGDPYYGDYVAAGEFFPSIGNHEYADCGGIDAYLAYYNLPGNERYYSVVRGPVEMFMLNMEGSEPDGGGHYEGAQRAWFDAAVAASTAPWKMVFMHRPGHTTDPRGGTGRVREWPFEALGVDAVFAGHYHAYEVFYFDIDGDGREIPYIVNGAGRRSDDLGGGLIVRIDDTTAAFEFWNKAGVKTDSFTMTK